MFGTGTGNATPEKRKARAVLSVREPFIESLLACLDFDGVDIQQLRAFGKQCWSSRNAWDVNRRRSGLFGSRLPKADAERALRQELAKLFGSRLPKADAERALRQELANLAEVVA